MVGIGDLALQRMADDRLVARLALLRDLRHELSLRDDERVKSFVDSLGFAVE